MPRVQGRYALLGAGLRCLERAVQCQSFALHVAEPLLRIFLKKEMLASSPTRSAIDTQNSQRFEGKTSCVFLDGI